MARRGQEHHNAKLSDKQVEAMRVLHKRMAALGKPKGYGYYARLFKCGRMTVRDIILRRTR